MIEARDQVTVTLRVNGAQVSGRAEPRMLLSDFLRHRLWLTGTHVGCEHGVCGACTVLIDGEPARSCLTFAVQVDGSDVTTVEGLALADGELHPVQQAFHDHHAMQCGFCTPGFVLSLVATLEANPNADDEELLDALSGNLCRCTGYANILSAARQARERMR
jgi:aerobic-type carbon monoxide dehydrogenase small subunit (CoxS/CutS family)